MTHDDRSLERAARSWLEEGPTRAPDRAVDAALLQIDTTSQERDLRIPWRLPTMSPITRVAGAAIAIAIAVGAAILIFRPVAQVGPPAPTIEGTWEVSFTRAEMLAAGIADPGEDDPSNYGHFVLTFSGGHWNLVQQDGPKATGGSTYTITGQAIALYSPQDNATFSMPFTVTETTLTFGRGGPITFRVKPWARVAQAPGPSGPAASTASAGAWSPAGS